VAIKYTDNPEEVAQVMEYLASEPVVREFSERTLFLPAHAGIVAAGDLQFESEDPNVQPALERFVAASTETLPAADALPGLALGQCLLRRARHAHKPGHGGRDHAGGGARADGPRHRRSGRRGPAMTGW
jgi:hypothetical protein